MNWYTLKGFAGQLLSSMADASLSAVVLAASVAMLILFLRRNSSAQHALWTAVMMGMLALLVLRPVIPAAHLHLPQPVNLETVATGPDSPGLADSADARASTHLPRAGSRALRLGWPEYAVLGYLSVTLLLALRLLLGLFLSWRLLRSSRPIGAELWEHFDSVMAAGGEVQLEDSSRLRVPVTTGVWRMRVILPVDWRAWPAEKLQAVLAHELAHARRRDPLIALLAAVNKCVFWFHPLAWWLERRLAVLAEHAADDAAIAASRDAQSYARVVLEVASSLQQQSRRLIWHDVAVNRTALTGPLIALRIRRIMDQRSRNYAGKLGRLTRIMLLSGAVLLVWMSTAVDFQSVARAQENQLPLPGAEPSMVFTHPPSQEQSEADRQSGRNLISFLSDGNQASSNPVTEEQAAAMERQLALNPEDEDTRARLIRHYFQIKLEDKRVSLVLWLVDHHPESEVHGNQTAAIFPGGPHGNPVVFADAKSRWLEQVNQHPESATIIGNAARVLNANSLREGIVLMKRAQALDPAHRTQPIAWLYSMLLMQSSDPRRAKASPLGLQVRHELQASNDIVIVGAVARYVAGMSVDKSPANNELKAIAEELIKHAQALDPQGSEWPALMERHPHGTGISAGPQGGIVVSPIGQGSSISLTPQLMHMSKEMAASALLDSETPAYPPEAQAIRLRGTAIVQVRISKDGHVTEAKALNGHPLLIQPAIEAVKRYVYKPFMINGVAVDVSTIVEVTFRE